jgi:hypothetical protein
MAPRSRESRPLTHRPFSILRSEADQELEEMGYAPSPSTPKQKQKGSGDKKNGKRRTANRTSKKSKENAVAATTSRASSAKKKATSRKVTRAGGKEKSTLSDLGESALEVAAEDIARPMIRGAATGFGVAGGVIIAGNLASKTGMKVPLFS